MWHADRRLLHRTPGPVLFGTCICSSFATASRLFQFCHVFRLWISDIPRYFHITYHEQPIHERSLKAREKGKDLTLSYDKSPYNHKKISKNQRDITKMPPKTSITHRLRTDLGWSVGVTIATKLKLNRFTGSQPSHEPQKLCNQKDTHLNICK